LTLVCESASRLTVKRMGNADATHRDTNTKGAPNDRQTCGPWWCELFGAPTKKHELNLRLVDGELLIEIDGRGSPPVDAVLG